LLVLIVVEHGGNLRAQSAGDLYYPRVYCLTFCFV
jgi:hypothetical protein